jgi:hypothetical protein
VTILNLGSVPLGAVLGRLFKVWILIPVAMMAAFASAIYHDAGLLRALLECAVLLTCLQIGYVSGLFSRPLPGKLQQLGRAAARPARPRAWQPRGRGIFFEAPDKWRLISISIFGMPDF